MNELILFKLIDLALNAAAVGLERDAIVGKVREMEERGATRDEISDALQRMRDDAIAAARRATGG